LWIFLIFAALVAVVYKVMEYFYSGAVAGLTVDIVLFPVDTIKTRLQSKHGFSASGGFRGVYRGLSAVSVGSVPSAALFFGAYEIGKREGPFGAVGNQLFGSVVGETSSNLFRVPLDTIKQRMQAGHHKSLRNAISHSQPMTLFAALPVTLLRDIPFAACQMLIYEYLKTCELPVSFAGFVAGGLSGFLTTPLDVVRTRLMLLESKGSVPTVLNELWREGGCRSLFKGVSMRCLWISAGGSIFFTSYESVRVFMRT
jgi:solute carrier family 25 (mitochondrial S-adenosylmethionine transporter), member 26